MRLEVCAQPPLTQPPPVTGLPETPTTELPETGEPFQPVPEGEPAPPSPDHWSFENPCEPCDPIARALEAANARMRELLRKLDALQNDIDAVEAHIRKIRERIHGIDQRLEGTAGTGGSIYNPETGTTTEGVDQGDGTYLFTVKDARGRVIDQYTRPVRSHEELRREREALRAELEALEATLETLTAQAAALEPQIEKTELEMAELTASLERCIAELCFSVLSVLPFDPEGDVFTPDGVKDQIPSDPETPPPPPPPPEADVLVSKADSRDPVDAGGDLTYTLTVRNEGPSAATSVVATDTLPAGATPGNPSAGQGSCTTSGQIIRCDLGSLAAGASTTITIPVVIDDSAMGTLINSVTVTAAEDDPNGANNVASESTAVTPQGPPPQNADLGVLKSASAMTVRAGDPLAFTLEVSNAGPADATGVTLTDTLPNGVALDGVTPSQGTCAVANGTIDCTLGAIPRGGEARVEVQTTVSDSASGSLTNTAIVQGAETDPSTSNNTATSSTEVEAPPQDADVSIAKSDSIDPVTAGDAFTYVLDVRNDGPAQASGVGVSDTLPPGLTATAATSSAGSCTPSGQSVTCQIGDLPAMGSARIEIDVQTSDTATGTLTNTATVTASSPDPNSANNQASETTTIQQPVPQNCALDIMPGDYTGDTGCGSNGMVRISCTGPHQVIIENGFRVVCDGSGDCGDANEIFGQPNHDCEVVIENGRPCLVCRELDAMGQPTGRQCRECFTKIP